jgi:hypothetical protein
MTRIPKTCVLDYDEIDEFDKLRGDEVCVTRTANEMNPYRQ